MHGLLLVLTCILVPVPGRAEPLPSARETTILGASAVPPEILALLEQTRNSYGPDAVVLQLQLLHHAIHAGSILPAGVRVAGIEAHRAQRYLVYGVETGIVFNSSGVDRRQRVSRLWSGIVLEALGRLETCEVPADGIAVELTYFHRPYQRIEEIEDTVRENPGQDERAAFYIRRSDILSFRQHDIDASELSSRSHARVDGLPFAEPLLAEP